MGVQHGRGFDGVSSNRQRPSRDRLDGRRPLRFRIVSGGSVQESFIASSDLLELDQGSTEVFRMEKQYRLSVGTHSWFTIAQDPGALCGQLVAGDRNVSHFVANVMHSSGRGCVRETVLSVSLHPADVAIRF